MNNNLQVVVTGFTQSNQMRMKFVPVEGTKVLFSVWATRVQDYAVFAEETKRQWERPEFHQGPVHPVVLVSWEDAVAFCVWLSKTEGRKYRLPTDAEWSLAVGLGVETGATPEEKDGKLLGYPWGAKWPPPRGAGNYDLSFHTDSFENTSPVGSFLPSSNGLCDLGGNVWEWCEDWYDGTQQSRVLRGGSWYGAGEYYLRSSARGLELPKERAEHIGFRCVLDLGG
jgi:formylglycine-generating enzyme required for sulfatase activity